MKKLTTLDKYILKQVIEVFILGVVVFTSIIFASDTFISLIKQISNYGMPFNIAFMIILLNLPSPNLIFIVSLSFVSTLYKFLVLRFSLL